MKEKEKEEIMTRFRENKVSLLVSTTVIEVGVNVPNATIMVIENAERFGLSQLHQLRGRVGRGEHKSLCILIGKAKSDTTKRRMEILTKSNDGFFIADEDLKLRGSGEIFGIRQHGESDMIIASVTEDFNIFKVANFEAKKLMNDSSYEAIQLKNCVLEQLDKKLKYICFN
jgi:ATP-dependent DNA helicase RecG